MLGNLLPSSSQEYVLDVDIVEENNQITEINLTVENNIIDNKIKTLKIKMEEICKDYRFLNNEDVIKVNINDKQGIKETFDVKKICLNY